MQFGLKYSGPLSVERLQSITPEQPGVAALPVLSSYSSAQWRASKPEEVTAKHKLRHRRGLPKENENRLLQLCHAEEKEEGSKQRRSLSGYNKGHFYKSNFRSLFPETSPSIWELRDLCRDSRLSPLTLNQCAGRCDLIIWKWREPQRTVGPHICSCRGGALQESREVEVYLFLGWLRFNADIFLSNRNEYSFWTPTSCLIIRCFVVYSFNEMKFRLMIKHLKQSQEIIITMIIWNIYTALNTICQLQLSIETNNQTNI